MPITIHPSGWDEWKSTIKDLARKYSFPANSLGTLNSYLALFSGEGSTFRCESASWKFVIDTIRSNDMIIDIATITLISKAENTAKETTGWVIAPRCAVHLGDETDVPITSSVKPAAKIMWYRITDGGRHTAYCCKFECDGPFKSGPWRVFDTARQGIVIKVLEQELITLWHRIHKKRGSSQTPRPVEARISRQQLEEELEEINQAYYWLRRESDELRAHNEQLRGKLDYTRWTQSRQLRSQGRPGEQRNKRRHLRA